MIGRALVIAAAVLMLSAAPAEAQYVQVTITVTSSVIPGGSVTVNITSFAPGSVIVIRILPSGEVDIGIINGSEPTTVPPTTPTTMMPVTIVPTTDSTMEPTTTTHHRKGHGRRGRWGHWGKSGKAVTHHEGDRNRGRHSDKDGRKSGIDRDRKGRDRHGDSAARSKVLGTVVADAQGNATGTFPVPDDVEQGTAIVAASGASADGSEQTVASETAVKATGSDADGPVRPTKASRGEARHEGGGASGAPLGIICSGLVVGRGLVITKRRRRARMNR
jgi:hypothetical protein